MRFMMLMIPKGYRPGEPPAAIDPADMVTMGQYNDKLRNAGILLSLDGLRPPDEGVRLAFAGGTPTITDGPYAEAKEALGGYWIIQVKTKDEAVEWARRCPAKDGDVIELRRIQEFEDFPPEVQALDH